MADQRRRIPYADDGNEDDSDSEPDSDDESSDYDSDAESMSTSTNKNNLCLFSYLTFDLEILCNL